LEDGSVTPDHVDGYASATAKASDEVKAKLARRQKHLTEQAKKLTPERFRKYCERQVQDAERDQGLDRDEQQRKATRLRSWINAETGLRHIAGAFHPELGSRIWTAVEAEIAKTMMANESNRLLDRDQVAAQALGRLVAGGHATIRPNKADISVLIDLDTLRHGLHTNGICELSDSSVLPVETIRRLACDGNLIPIVFNGAGQVLDLGRSQRLASTAQRNALRAMHDTCAFPGCDVGFDNCEIHHIHDWDHLGPTDLANLVPKCSRHHHLVHEGGWHLRLNPDRTLQVWGPGENPPPDAVAQSKAGPHHRTGSNHAGSNHAGSNHARSNHARSEHAGSKQAGTNPSGSGRSGGERARSNGSTPPGSDTSRRRPTAPPGAADPTPHRPARPPDRGSGPASRRRCTRGGDRRRSEHPRHRRSRAGSGR
jgi:hypothetical protein